MKTWNGGFGETYCIGKTGTLGSCEADRAKGDAEVTGKRREEEIGTGSKIREECTPVVWEPRGEGR